MLSKIILIGSIALSTVLLFVGQSNRFAAWFVEVFLSCRVDEDTFKDSCLLAGTIVSSAAVPFQVYRIEQRRKSNEEALNTMLQLWKNVLTGLIRDITHNNSLRVNVRIYLPKKWYKKPLKLWLSNITFFMARHIDALSENDAAKNVSFEVSPTPRGLVGAVYANNCIAYDLNLSTNSVAQYNLSSYHAQILRPVKLGFAIPIVDTTNEIKYIVTIDSSDSIQTLSAAEEQKLVTVVIDYLTLSEDLLQKLTLKPLS